MTRGDEILDAFDAGLRELRAFELVHYAEADVRDVVLRLGSKMERFFKSAVWPGTPAEHCWIRSSTG